MAETPDLDPRVRERTQPRISATSLAEYLIYRSDGQETVLHDSRFARSYVTASYQDAMRGIRAYCTDPARPNSVLESVKAALLEKSEASTTTPKGKANALGEIEALNLFQDNVNAFGIKGLRLEAPPRFEPLNVHGVAVSVQPDLIARFKPNREGASAAAGFIRLAKVPDPNSAKLEETRTKRGEHRREMARYMIALSQLLLEEQGSSLGSIERAECFVADIRLGERIGPATDNARRIKAIQAACRQIATLWDDIKPRPSVLKRK